MTDYNPPISTRELDEVLSIALDNGDNWQPDAIAQAKQELKKRGVTDSPLRCICNAAPAPLHLQCCGK